MPQGRALALLLVVFVVIAAKPANASGDGGAPAEGLARVDAPAVEPPIELTEVLYAVPPDYDTFVQWWQQLEAQYPNFLRVWSPNQAYGLGQVPSSTAHPPYDLYYVRLTNESRPMNRPEVFFMGNPHGDERTGPIGAYWFVHWLLRNAVNGTSAYGEWLSWILDQREVYFAISHNPDGFDRPRRGDYLARDLNREADHDGPEPGAGWTSVFQSVQGKTVARFMNEHQIRAGMDFHGGTRGLLYAWGSTRPTVSGVSPVTGRTWSYAPPDFDFFDVFSHRMGDFIGDFGGNYGATNVGTPPGIVGYEAAGTYLAWAYGADTAANPAEAPYVDFDGTYPGAGALWITPEISLVKNPAASTYGGDDTLGWGVDVRRMLLAMIEFAQPYVRWHPSGVVDGGTVQAGDTFPIAWQVNGSLVVDSTRVQWGADPDPVNNPTTVLPEHTDFAGMWNGGTGWEGALNGATSGTVWRETIRAPSATGTYYFVARAKVDQRYAQVLRPDVYGPDTYLRVMKERTMVGWSEDLPGVDGVEHMEYAEWWTSPVLRVTVVPDTTPPTITLRSPPNGSVIRAGTPLDFQITDGRLAGANVSVDGGVPVNLPSPWDVSTAGWPDGPHGVRVNATDQGGFSTSRNYTFVLDSTPPTIALVTPPAGSIVADGAVLDFAVTDAHLTSVYWSTGGPDALLLPPYDVGTAGWPEGPVSITITAMDAAGNVRADLFGLTIDAGPPLVTLVSPAAGSTIPAGTVLDFEVADVSAITATWDAGAGPMPLAAPWDVDTTGWRDGPVSVDVAATDAFGRRTDASFPFSIDGAPPQIVLMSPANGSLVEPGTVLDFEVSDAYLDTVTWATATGSGILFPPYDLGTAGWPDGTVEVEVRARDVAGLEAVRRFVFSLDSTPPTVTRTDAGTLFAPGHRLAFDVGDAWLDVVTWSDGGPPTALAAPYAIDTAGWADGDYAVVVRAVDRLGHATVLSVAVSIDGTGPTIAAVSPADGTVARPGVVAAFSVADAHAFTATLSLDGGASSGFAPPYEVETTGWADGEHVLEVRATDELGNVGTATLRIVIDGTPPGLTDLAADAARVGAPVPVRVLVAEPHGPTPVTLHWRVGDGTWRNLPMADAGGGEHRATIPVQNATGVLEFYVTAVDGVGNAAQTDVQRSTIAPGPAPATVPWLWIGVAATAIVAAFLLALRRRRSSRAEGTPPERGDVGKEREQEKEKE